MNPSRTKRSNSVLKFQTSAIFHILGVLSPLIYIVDTTLGCGILSPLTVLDDASGFHIEELVIPFGFVGRFHGNCLMCAGYYCVGRFWVVMYFIVCLYNILAVFSQFKLFLTTIACRNILSNTPFLTGKAFIHSTSK